MKLWWTLVSIIARVTVVTTSISEGDNAQTISLCTSTVYLNQKSIVFHVDHKDYLLTAAKQFCQLHFIDSNECHKIVEFHKRKCFDNNDVVLSEQQQYTDTKEDSTSSSASTASTTATSSQPEQQDQQQQSLPQSPSSLRVDYSGRSGPILKVTHPSGVHSLQAYLNEEPGQAVNRFCKMLSFEPVHCTQVRQHYFQLCGIPTTEDSSTQTLTATATATSAPSLGGSLEEGGSGSSVASVYSWVCEVVDGAISWLREYWNIVTLVIVVLYVIVEQQGAAVF